MTETNLADVAPEEAPPTFDSLPLSAAVRRAVRELGFTAPTPVQLAVFEPAAKGLDLVVQARTGTGKTAAFGLPIVDQIVDGDLLEPQVLILAPTRELALQISRELEALARYKEVRCAAVYGGAAMQPQIDAIRRGAHVIAGTPGRVLDHLERGTLDPSTLQLLVLDESDEMLSMGFLPQITKIMEQMPTPHQTLLFSATVPPDVKRIAETRLDHPQFITLSGDHIGALSIDHFVYRSRGAKSEELVQLIEVENPESAIVFCNTREQTKRIAGALQRSGYAADWLNADLSQSDREKVMAATREGRLRFLVATDVAARGIDISHLTHVINADFPESTENYVHRTGRTGRAGRTGTAISLIAPQDVGNLYMLRLTYKIFPVERELPSPRELQTRKEADLLDFLSEAFEGHPRPDDLSLARRVLESPAAEAIVAGLLRDHLGAHPNAAGAAAQSRREGRGVPPALEQEGQAQVKSAKPGSKSARKESQDVDVPVRDAPVGEESPEGKREKKEKKRKKKDRKKDKRESFEPGEAAQVERSESEIDERAAAPSEVSRGERSSPRLRNRNGSSARPAASIDRNQGGELEVVRASDILGGAIDDLLDEEEEHIPRRSTASPRRERVSTESATQSPAPQGFAPDSPAPRGPGVLGGPTPREAHQDPTRANRAEEGEQVEGLSRIFVNVGKKEGVRARDLRSVLSDGGIHPDDIDFVSVKEKHSFISVVEDLEKQAIELLSAQTFGEIQVRAERARTRC